MDNHQRHQDGGGMLQSLGSKESDMTDWLTDRPEPFPCHLANTTPSSQAQLP